MKMMFLGSNMHMMMQMLEEDAGSGLPHSLSVMNAYTKMTTWNKRVAVVVKNQTTALITIAKGIKVTWVVATNVVPQVEVAPGTLEKVDRMQGVQRVKMLTWQRKEALFQQLDWSGLEGWSAQDWAGAHTLLVEYHDIFSLEPGELGCMDLAKHEIRVVDDKPFKERFQRIPPPMVDEVHTHVKEMLEVGTICPSQSPWCNTVVLVCKKDRSLQFCINFWKLNMMTKKDSYPLPKYKKPLIV